jgi:hypothetical protein
MYDDNDDRKRRGENRDRTWKEIDALRDKSRHRDRDPMQKQSSPTTLVAQKTYRAALERAFASGKLGELARTLSKNGDDSRPRAPEQPAEAAAPDAQAAAQAAPAPGNGAAATAEAAAAPALPPPLPVAARDPDREQRQKLIGKIREAEGRDAITRAVDAFLVKYDRLPDDYEVLTKVLGHKSDDRVQGVLEQLTRLIQKEKPRRARTLVAQLRYLEDTHKSPDVRQQAAAVRGLL